MDVLAPARLRANRLIMEDPSHPSQTDHPDIGLAMPLALFAGACCDRSYAILFSPPPSRVN